MSNETVWMHKENLAVCKGTFLFAMSIWTNDVLWGLLNFQAQVRNVINNQKYVPNLHVCVCHILIQKDLQTSSFEAQNFSLEQRFEI